jgi:septal ring factor EnvC (AmiA/AmiB activator)
MDVSEEGKFEAAQIIEALRTQVKHLEDELLAVKASRNTYQSENAQLKKQLARLQRQEQRAA